MCENIQEPNWDVISGYIGTEEGDDPRVLELEPKHLLGISMLLQGKTRSEVAAALSVSQRTVRRWMEYGSKFREVLMRRQIDMWRASKRRMMALYLKSLERLNGLLDSDDEYIVLKAIDTISKGAKQEALFDPDKTAYPYDYPISMKHYEIMKDYSTSYYKEPERISMSKVRKYIIDEMDYDYSNSYAEARDASWMKINGEILKEIKSVLTERNITYNEFGWGIEILDENHEAIMKLRLNGYSVESVICLHKVDKYCKEFPHEDAIKEFYDNENDGKIVYAPPDFLTQTIIPEVSSINCVIDLAEKLQISEKNG